VKNKLGLVVVAAVIITAVSLYLLFKPGHSSKATGRIGSDCTLASANKDISATFNETRYPADSADAIGRRIRGWDSWISEIAPGLYAGSKDIYDVYVYANNPFAVATDAPSSEKRTSNSYDIVDLCCLNSADAHRLSVGQHIVFCGEIDYGPSTRGDNSVEIPIADPVINARSFAQVLNEETVPGDFRIRYEEHGCGEGYSCPDFSVTIDATGQVVYEGYSGTRIAGTVVTEVSQEKLSELVTLLKRSEFFADENHGEAEIRPAGSTVISVTEAKRQKTIAWNWRNRSIPSKLQLIPGKVHEMTDVWQWIRLWPELDDD
jgi:hypothetical protein